jgi:hypothetical protein
VAKIILGAIALWLLFWVVLYGTIAFTGILLVVLSPVIWLLRRVHLTPAPERRRVVGIQEADDWNTEHPDNPLMVDHLGNVSVMHSPPLQELADL